MQASVAAIASLTLLGVALYCHRRLRAIFPEDPPAQAGRHRHQQPTPMAGFVPALVALFGLATITPSGWLLAGVFIATAIGYLDDRGKAEHQEMAWLKKGLGLLLGAACVTVHFATTHQLSIVELGFVLGWLFALTNAVNFLDNTDGVAASAGGMGLLLATDGTGQLAFAGYAFLGFLPFNWPRPMTFLGDSGSLSLGMCLAAASLQYGLTAAPVDSSLPIYVAACLPLLIFALDFVQVIAARLFLGVPPWEGDRRHLTHIAIHLGLPKLLIAPLFAGLGYLGFATLQALPGP